MYIIPKFYLDFILYNKSKILIFIKKSVIIVPMKVGYLEISV